MRASTSMIQHSNRPQPKLSAAENVLTVSWDFQKVV